MYIHDTCPPLWIVNHAATAMQVEFDDLVDATEVATILGLINNRAVAVYRTRYDGFPEPVLRKGAGRCLL